MSDEVLQHKVNYPTTPETRLMYTLTVSNFLIINSFNCQNVYFVRNFTQKDLEFKHFFQLLSHLTWKKNFAVVLIKENTANQ